MSVNRVFSTAPVHEVLVTSGFGRSFSAGSGVIMSDPDNPVVAPVRVFAPQPGEDAEFYQEEPATGDVGLYSFRYVYSWEMERFSQTLFANFKGSFGWGSASAAASYARSRKDEWTSVVILMERRVAHTSVGDTTWRAPPVSEQSPDQDVLEQFVRTYGSHFMVAGTSGYRAAFKADVRSVDERVKQTFKASVEGIGSGWKAGGSAAAEAIRVFKSIQAAIEGTVSGGAVQKRINASWTPYEPVLRSIDEIDAFIDEIRSQEIRFTPGLVSATLHSYWATIDLATAPRTKTALAEWNGPATPPASFGVPRGTVMAWHPQNDARNPFGHFETPEGWAICDGTTGTPNLVERFVRGVGSWDSSGQVGGASDHSHTGKTRVPNGREGQGMGTTLGADARRDHTHNFTTRSASHLPPFFDLVYIMKL